MVDPAKLASSLRGIIVPMVSPLAAADRLDTAGLERLVDRLLHGGVHGIFVLGSCGEGPSLEPALQRELVERVCQQVGGRIPIIVGVTHTCAQETMALARHSADVGADAIVAAPPFYFPLDQSELQSYTTQLAAASPLPVLLYNMPALTKVAFEPETVRRLMDDPRIIGLKDSSGDLSYFRATREATRGRSDWTLLVGPEHLLTDAMSLGGDGGVCGGANVVPQLYVQLYEAARTGFDDELAAFESDVARLGHIYSVASPSGFNAASTVKGLKGALATLGVCSGRPAPPLTPLSAVQTEQVKQILHSLRAAGEVAAVAQQ